MSVDAQTIRSEGYGDVGSIIRNNVPTLTQRWAERAVAEQPSAARAHHKDLLDHVPSFLYELAEQLAKEGDAFANGHCRPANEHGEQRWEVGWSLAEVIRDYRILRLVILDYLDDQLDRPLQVREVHAVGLALDEAIQASVEQYVRSRDEWLERAAQKQAAALRDVDRRKNEFLATLAHELRNPLAPLRNSLEIVRLGGDSAASIRPVRELMERQVGQLSRLVDDLLDVTRIAQGKLDLRLEPLDLSRVVEQAVQMNAPLRAARRQQLSVDLPPQPLWVMGDTARLIQVCVNLLNNAVKYSPERAAIQVEAGREDAAVVLRVRDNGAGIPPEMLSHIFELFTQIDVGVERSQGGGLGIGLTLVRKLVELHGGTIAAKSAGLGQGSEFVVRLPAHEAPAAPSSSPSESPAVVRRHIQIIEDNPDGRESLALLLRLLGHRVEVAEDGIRGVEQALALRPGVALVDVGLPGLNGYEVAIRLREALGPKIFLVALTGHSDPESRERALDSGFDTHLIKPVELSVLENILATLRA